MYAEPLSCFRPTEQKKEKKSTIGVGICWGCPSWKKHDDDMSSDPLSGSSYVIICKPLQPWFIPWCGVMFKISLVQWIWYFMAACFANLQFISTLFMFGLTLTANRQSTSSLCSSWFSSYPHLRAEHCNHYHLYRMSIIKGPQPGYHGQYQGPDGNMCQLQQP